MTGDGKVAGWTQVNGELADSLPLSDRGLAYGDGLFETLRVVGGAQGHPAAGGWRTYAVVDASPAASATWLRGLVAVC